MKPEDFKPMFKLADFAAIAVMLVVVVIIYSDFTTNFTDSAGVSSIRAGWKLGLCLLASYSGYWLYRRALEPELRLHYLINHYREIKRNLQAIFEQCEKGNLDQEQLKQKNVKLQILDDERRELVWLMISVMLGRAFVMGVLPLGVALAV